MKKEATLVILAAGIGSRYGGGIKQLEAVGPSGEIIVDYSIHDAVEAGFEKIVFIIRHDLEEDFYDVIGKRMELKYKIAYAFQELSSLPDGFAVPEGRKKPWGTTHALLCAKEVIDGPFLVINADDYYGKEGYRLAYEYLMSHSDVDAAGRHELAILSFLLGNTLSDNGGVTRGLCRMDDTGRLVGIDETKNIIRTGDGAAILREDGPEPIDTNVPVSMNMWAAHPAWIEELERRFQTFLGSMEDPLTEECLLPITVDEMLKDDKCSVHVLRSPDRWFGVTYQEDKAAVKEEFAKLIADGVYTSPLDQ